MQISERSLQALGRLITGDEGKSPYRSGQKLVRFFNAHGANDVYASGFPSRWDFAEQKLRQFNGTPTLAAIIAEVLSPQSSLGTDFIVADAVSWLNEYLVYDGFEVRRNGLQYRVFMAGQAVVSYTPPATPIDPLTHAFILEQVDKCRDKLDRGDHDAAITNARALLEGVLRELEHRLTGQPPKSDGDLLKQYKRVQKLMNHEPTRKDISGALTQVLRGFVSVVSGIAGLRNSMSDAHARSFRPSAHHARLVVNSVHTLADFLAESFDAQLANGSIVLPGARGPDSLGGQADG